MRLLSGCLCGFSTAESLADGDIKKTNALLADSPCRVSEAILLLSNAVAQETETSIERVVVAAPEVGPTNASAVDPDVLGLTGDFRRIDAVMPNVSINDAGADSFEDVYTVRGLNNTPNFSKQALIIYVDDVPRVSTFTKTCVGNLTLERSVPPIQLQSAERLAAIERYILGIQMLSALSSEAPGASIALKIFFAFVEVLLIGAGIYVIQCRDKLFGYKDLKATPMHLPICDWRCSLSFGFTP